MDISILQASYVGSWAYEICCFWLVSFSILPNRVIIQYLNTPIEEKEKGGLLWRSYSKLWL